MVRNVWGVVCMLTAAGIALAWLLCGWTVPMPNGWTEADTFTLVIIMAWLYSGSRFGGDQ